MESGENQSRFGLTYILLANLYERLFLKMAHHKAHTWKSWCLYSISIFICINIYFPTSDFLYFFMIAMDHAPQFVKAPCGEDGSN